MSKHRTPRQRAKAAFKALVAEAGGKSRLAAALGTNTSTPYRWSVLASEYLRKAVEVFGGAPEDYRPDLSAYELAQAMKPPEEAQPVKAEA